MIQPGTQTFDWILAHWWIIINRSHVMPMRIARGGADPMLDWIHQSPRDLCWFYSLDQWTESDFQNRMWLAQHMPEFDSIHILTALSLTCGIDPELTHDMEIPGVWICRVQKV